LIVDNWGDAILKNYRDALKLIQYRQLSDPDPDLWDSFRWLKYEVEKQRGA